MRRSMLALVVVLAPALVLVACGGGTEPTATPASASARPTPTTTEEPVFTPPPEEISAKLKQVIPIVDLNGADLGTVAVLAGKRYTKVGTYFTADKGKAWIGARVQYTAVTPFMFNLFDWVAHDDEGNQFQPSGYALDPQLEAGTLAKGRKVQGWVPFEVPSGVKALWVDYAPASAGGVIFSVKVYSSG